MPCRGWLVGWIVRFVCNPYCSRNVIGMHRVSSSCSTPQQFVGELPPPRPVHLFLDVCLGSVAPSSGAPYVVAPVGWMAGWMTGMRTADDGPSLGNRQELDIWY